MKQYRLAAVVSLFACAGLAHADDQACQVAKLQVDVAHTMRTNICRVDPRSNACLAEEQKEKLYLQLLDLQCPAPTPLCQVNRQTYDLQSATRSALCRQAGSSSDPSCVAATNAETVQYLQYKVNCLQP